MNFCKMQIKINWYVYSSNSSKTLNSVFLLLELLIHIYFSESLVLHITSSSHKVLTGYKKKKIHYGYFDPLLIIHLKPEKMDLFKVMMRSPSALSCYTLHFASQRMPTGCNEWLPFCNFVLHVCIYSTQKTDCLNRSFPHSVSQCKFIFKPCKIWTFLMKFSCHLGLSWKSFV